jgi:hypothetical protein
LTPPVVDGEMHVAALTRNTPAGEITGPSRVHRGRRRRRRGSEFSRGHRAGAPAGETACSILRAPSGEHAVDDREVFERPVEHGRSTVATWRTLPSDMVAVNKACTSSGSPTVVGFAKA